MIEVDKSVDDTLELMIILNDIESKQKSCCDIFIISYFNYLSNRI